MVRTVSYAAGTFVTFTIKVDRKDREVVISGLGIHYQILSSFRNLVILSSVCRVDPILPSQLEFMSDLLGSGGSATVHKAKYLGAMVAVKTLLGDDDDSSWEQVVRELEILTHMSHPNIVHMHGVSYGFNTNDRLGIVMDFYPFDLNKLLFDERYRSCWNCKVFDRLLYGIICGMRFLHRSGLIHRDLKPHNVLITDRFESKIADFGIAFREHIDDSINLTESGGSRILPVTPESQLSGQYVVVVVFSLNVLSLSRLHVSFTYLTRTQVCYQTYRGHSFLHGTRDRADSRSKTIAIQFVHRCVEFQYYIVGNDITHKGIQHGEAQVHDVEKDCSWRLSFTNETCSET